MRTVRPSAFKACPTRHDRQPVGAGRAHAATRSATARGACAISLRGMGHDVRALRADDRRRAARTRCGRSTIRRRARGDLTIFHFALPSPMTEAFAPLRTGRRVLQYHNVTPAAFFAPYDPALFRLASLARQELATLVGRVDLALGVSEFNRRELETLGFRPTGVLPLAVDLSRITRPAERPALEKILDDEFVNFLFVGRIAPNKKIEDHIRLAEHYKRYVDAYLPVHLRRPLRRRAALLFDDSRADVRVPAARTSASSSPVRSPTRISPSTTGTRRSTSR